MMWEPTVGKWCVQLRLGLACEAEVPEVWATLGEERRSEVIQRLAQTMVNAVVAPSGQGGEQPGEVDQSHESSEGDREDATRIA